MNTTDEYNLLITSGASAATVFYIYVPQRCTLNDVDMVTNAGLASGRTFTFNDGSNSLGVYTFASSTAAGSTGTWAANSSHGTDVIDAGDILKITQSSTATAATVHARVRLDFHARQKSDFS